MALATTTLPASPVTRMGPTYSPPARFVAEVNALLARMGLAPALAPSCTCRWADQTGPDACRSIGCDPECPEC